MSSPDIGSGFLVRTRERIEQALDAYLPPLSDPANLAPDLNAAMRYAVMSGGKRLRPLLVCATTASLSGDWGGGGHIETALAPACALEFIHAYSLIHDDLPAMDNDDLRHGQPSCHKAFGEATAILAGDALQALAFNLLADASSLALQVRLALISLLANASGWQGMVGGQARDMSASGTRLGQAELEAMHKAKTGALLRTALEFGGLCAGAGPETSARLRHLGERIGLAFQVVDDLLDVTQSTQVLGKTAGKDAGNGKNTYPALLGVAGTRALADQLLVEIQDGLAALGLGQSPLAELAALAVRRLH